MADLLINGDDAYLKYGVRMGTGFLNALGTPLDMKEDVENESRIENGKQILLNNRRVASREVNLEFTIQGSSPTEYQLKKLAFLNLLYNQKIKLQVPDDSDAVYRLVYKGVSSTYAQSKNRRFCKMTLRFTEPDPTDRGKS